MKKCFILAGMLFDDSQGHFVNYLTYEYGIKQIVRYNGRTRPSNTMIIPEEFWPEKVERWYKFDQIGSGMDYNECNTYISNYALINPIKLMYEIMLFSQMINSSTTELINRVFIDENAFLVTEYDEFLNLLNNLIDSVTETKKLGIQQKDLAKRDILRTKLENLYYYICEFYRENEVAIEIESCNDLQIKCEIEFFTNKNSINYICSELMKYNKFSVCSNNNEIINVNEGIIFEGTHGGVLIDEVYGISNTKFDSTIRNALYMVSELGISLPIQKIGVTKAFVANSGKEVFPTEDVELTAIIVNELELDNCEVKAGWFDAVLIRYAQKVNIVDELYLSSLECLSSIKTIKLCNAYMYSGEIDEKFKKSFEYEVNADNIIVRNIKIGCGDISKYLKHCKPIYTKVDGWMEDISTCKSKEELPIECIKYISLINKVSGIKISMVSVENCRMNIIIV